ncbi:hypothetical protein RhiirA1_480539, partial [Rhizophagus irregularis]
ILKRFRQATLDTIKLSWNKIKDDLINPKHQPLPTVSSYIIFEKIILKEKIENEIKKYNNHKIRKTSTWAVNMLKQLNELVNFIESYESQQDDSIQLIPNNPEYKKMKQHYYELDLRIQRGKIFELALRRKLEIERIYKKTGTKLYNRIKAQIALTDRNIQNAVSKYNEIIETFSYSNCDIQIIQNWKTVCDIESEFWKKYLNEEMLPNVDPLIKKGINSMLTLNRYLAKLTWPDYENHFYYFVPPNEELNELQLEIERVKVWGYQYINILKLIEIEINTEMDIELNFTRIKYKKGIIKWIINEKLNIENQMNEFEFLLKNLNKKNIENTEDDNNEYLYDNKIDKLDIDEIELNENNEI